MVVDSMNYNDINSFESDTFKTIYADPPWNEQGGGKIQRGADRHYPLMKDKEILGMADDVKRISQDNAHLYLWTTNNFLPLALDVMKAWGFEYKTCITWVKDRIGLGQYFRGMTEHCLFGVRGSLPYKINENSKRMQGYTALVEKKKRHSQKPESMREMIEKVSYPPYIELFARTRHPHWSCWGNDIENFYNFLLQKCRMEE